MEAQRIVSDKICSQCQKEVLPGHKFVRVKQFVALKSRSREVGKDDEIMHRVCYHLATGSPELDLNEFGEMAK